MSQEGFTIPESLPQKINKAKSFLVVLPKNLNLDSAAAALALFLSLKKKNKRVKIGCPVEMTVEYNRLFGVDKISQEIGSRNLIVSFDYIEDSIEKVSYHVANRKFNLVIQPKNGFEPLDSKKVEYNYGGADADIIFIIGTQKLEDLGSIYEQNEKVFNEAETVNIDLNPANTKFGKTNLVLPTQTAMSQIVARIFKKLNLAVDQDIATNIIAGIESATNFLQSRTTAGIFDTMAWAMRHGGKQGHLQGGVSTFAPVSTSPFTTLPAQPQQAQTAPPQTPPSFTKQQTKASQQTNNSGNSEEKTSAPTPDWFKPKIFSSGMKKG